MSEEDTRKSRETVTDAIIKEGLEIMDSAAHKLQFLYGIPHEKTISVFNDLFREHWKIKDE